MPAVTYFAETAIYMYYHKKMDRDPMSRHGIRRRVFEAAVVSGVAIVAVACASNNGGTAEAPTASVTTATAAPQTVPETFATTTPATTAETAPAATRTTLPLSECNSVRAVRPGAYYNQSYASHIDAQLHTMQVALTPNANTDLNSDYIPWLEMSHAMEDDPEYAGAMYQAYKLLSENPGATVTSAEILSWHVAPPPLCAPQRTTDAASHEQLEETKQVSGAVFDGLTEHLGVQTSRLGKLLLDKWESAWQTLENEINGQLNS